MGGLCCCPRPEDFEEYTSYPNGSMYQNCFCLRCCVRWCLRMYSSYIDPGEGRENSSPNQSVSGSQAAGLLGTPLDTDLPDTFRPPPRPLPYDIDPSRYSRIARDGLVSRRDKSSMSQLHGVEAEPLRQRSTGDGGSEALTQMQRRNGSTDDFDEQTEKRSTTKGMGRNESMLSLTDDEDSCPTCLDGYTEENPKITPQCGHHFHLGCILEWMERSKRCPVCDKEMVFSESV